MDPVPAAPYQQHELADPGRALQLAAAIEDDPALLRVLEGQHLISVRQLPLPTVAQLFRRAALLEGGGSVPKHAAAGRIMNCAFLDSPDARAQLSFESAWLRLGGSVIDMGKVFRELGGEASVLTELAQLANSFGDLAVVRTSDSGGFHRLLDHFHIPVINAGDGDQENPTHGLADVYALMKWRPTLLQPEPPEAERLTIGIAGWPARSRSVRSFLLALARFPRAVKQVVLIGRHDPPFSPGQREELAQAGLTVQTDEELCGPAPIAECLRQIVPILDVAYAEPGPRPMLSRQASVELFEALKPHAMVLYPAIRRDDLREQLENSIHNGFFAQSRGAVFIRMALMEAMVGAASG